MDKPKKNPWRFLFWGCIAYGGLELLGGVFVNLLYLVFKGISAIGSREAVSIGIIGGADGPTAVFLTRPPWVSYLWPLLLLAVGICGLLYFRKEKKRNSGGGDQ